MDQNLWMIHKIFFIFFIMFSISNQITVFIFFLGGPLKFLLVFVEYNFLATKVNKGILRFKITKLSPRLEFCTRLGT